jgi:hypothetical protein
LQGKKKLIDKQKQQRVSQNKKTTTKTQEKNKTN